MLGRQARFSVRPKTTTANNKNKKSNDTKKNYSAKSIQCVHHIQSHTTTITIITVLIAFSLFLLSSHIHLAMTSSSSSSRNDLVSIVAPPGVLGLRFEAEYDEKERVGYVCVAAVDPQGPLHQKARVGDRVHQINEINAVDKDLPFVLSTFRANEDRHRNLVVQRRSTAAVAATAAAQEPTTSAVASQNTSNTTTTTTQNEPVVCPFLPTAATNPTTKADSSTKPQDTIDLTESPTSTTSTASTTDREDAPKENVSPQQQQQQQQQQQLKKAPPMSTLHLIN